MLTRLCIAVGFLVGLCPPAVICGNLLSVETPQSFEAPATDPNTGFSESLREPNEQGGSRDSSRAAEALSSQIHLPAGSRETPAAQTLESAPIAGQGSPPNVSHGRRFWGSKVKGYVKGVVLYVLIPILGAILAGVYVENKKRKSKVAEDVTRSFEVVPCHPTRESRHNISKHRVAFYTGGGDAHPGLYVAMDLDAERRLLGAAKTVIAERQLGGWFHIPIYGGRKQGKTILMARLAHDLSQQKGYCVLWCRQQGRTPFRRDLEEGIDLFSHVSELSEYRRYFARRRRLVLFIDDCYRPDLLASESALEVLPLKSLLALLNAAEIDVVTSASFTEGPDRAEIPESTPIESGPPLTLTLEAEDVKSILSKLQEQGHVTEELATKFLQDSSNRRVYKKQLFAFFSVLCSQSGCASDFKRDFEKQFDALSHEEVRALKSIALCQLIDVCIPEVVLQKAFPEVFQSLRQGLAGIIRREYDDKRKDPDYVYHMGGPFLAKHFLNDRVSVRTSANLESAFGSLIDILLGEDVFDSTPETARILRFILGRLAAGWYSPLFDIPGKPLARSLVCRSKDKIVTRLSTVAEVGDLVAWGATMRDLGQRDVARDLYHRALKRVQLPQGLFNPHDMRTPISLAMGLSAMPDSASRQASIVLLKQVIDKCSESKYPPWLLVRVVHKCAETTYRTGDPLAALEVVNGLPPTVPPDGLLLQLKGDILADRGSFQDASSCFRQAIDAAGSDTARNPQTFFNCLLHYADFLVTHSDAAKLLQEDPDLYLKQADSFFLSKGERLGAYEVLLNVRAKNQRRKRDVSQARETYERCLSDCRRRGVVHPHSWNDYAKLLIDCGDQLKERPHAAWLGEAEHLCREVVDDPDADRDSKCTTAHILGGLVGHRCYTFDGRKRPSFNEAVLILQDAFESPEPKRNDDRSKTYQDAITHMVLKDTYLEWYDSNEPAPNGRDSLLKYAHFHFQRAFSGLPRPDLSYARVVRHACLAQAHYAAFLWKPRGSELPDLDVAERHYRNAIAILEANSCEWAEAFQLYEFYANFLHDTQRATRVVITENLQKAMQLVPSGNARARANISWKLARNLHTDFIDALSVVPEDVQASKIDEVIHLFGQSLTLRLDVDDAHAAAGELSHVLFAPHRGLLRHLCTKDRVTTLTGILLRTWDICPANEAALGGVLDIGDSIIDRVLRDGSELDRLKKKINSKAVADQTAAETVIKVCEARQQNRHRGRLTDIIYNS